MHRDSTQQLKKDPKERQQLASTPQAAESKADPSTIAAPPGLTGAEASMAAGSAGQKKLWLTLTEW